MSLVRIALLNYSDKQVKLSITTGDKVDWTELMPDTDIKNSESTLQTQPADTAWDVVLEGGHIYGFVTEKGAKISEDASIKVIYESGKDPWPKPPPPPPPLFKTVGDYKDRFKAFLMAASLAPYSDLHITHEGNEPSFLIITPIRGSHSS